MTKKTIHFDIIHLAHLNFFKYAILELDKQGYNIEITYLDRGKIRKVLDKELPKFKKTKIGKYSKTTIGKIPMILNRLRLFIPFLFKTKPTVTAGVGDFILAFSSRILGIKSMMYYDDYEFKSNYNLSLLFGTKFHIPYALPTRGKKVVAYKSFKELAYLHPEVYKPNEKIITDIGLKPDEYVFAREVAGISMNYTELEQEGLLNPIKHLHNKGIKVVLSLEDKSRRKFYEPYCIILEEPLEDIYSIMHYALFMISSGDSMARESALLGVPCIYTGGRDMYVNHPFLEWEGIYKVEDEKKVIELMDQLSDSKQKQAWSRKINEIIKKDLKSTTGIIIDSLINKK